MEKNNLHIRDARPEDLDEVARLLKEAYRQYARQMPEEDWNSYLGDITDVRSRLEKSELIVAEIDGRLAGSVTLYYPGATRHWPEDWAGIRLLGVHPDYRGRGIGRALMDECVRRCREKGIKTIGLHTSILMDVARRMYEKMGFQRAPEFDHVIEPNVVIMAYRLDIPVQEGQPTGPGSNIKARYP